MTPEEMDARIESAMRARPEVADAVAQNKDRAVAAGLAVHVASSSLQAHADRLRTELAGYAAMPLDVRDAEGVRKVMWPRIAEYAGLRLALAAEAVMAEVAAELGVEPGWLAQLGRNLHR